jgi:hypothetical protein
MVANASALPPLVKVVLVVAIVAAVVFIMKTWLAAEPYRAFVDQTFETVPPQQFAVTPFPMMINADLTGAPKAVVPAAMPTVVPTYPAVPVMPQLDVPLLAQPAPMNELVGMFPEARVDVPEPVTVAPVLTQLKTSLPPVAPTMVPTFVPTSTAKPGLVTV